jgi:phosphatidylglycerol:prolipoprotein diacylglycerol transferase
LLLFTHICHNMAFLEIIHWHPDPILVDLGFLQPKWYGVLFVTGFALGYLFFKKEAVKHGITLHKIDTLLFMVLGFSIIGARLAHVFFYDWERYQNNLGDIIKIWEGGLASHGGSVGILLAVWIWCRYIAKEKMVKVLDLMAVPIPLAGAFIRFGNLWNSEILGKPTDVSWAFVFESYDLTPRHPVQLYEAICYILGSLILYLIYRKVGLAKPGLLSGLFLVVVFTPRFFLEFLKLPQDTHELVLGLTTGQLLSIPFILAGIFIIIYATRKGKTSATL